VTGVLILAGIGVLLGVEIAVLSLTVHCKLDWLKAVLVPWLNDINNKLDLPK
jgi:hypothetical protein